MDEIKGKIQEVIEKIKADKGLLEKFKKDPEKTIEDLLGVDIPDDKFAKVVSEVKEFFSKDALEKGKDKAEDIAKEVKDKAEDLLGDAKDKVKDLFK